MDETERSRIIARVCQAIERGAVIDAKSILEQEYPHAPKPAIKRRFRPLEYTQVFMRDGFVDRYSGELLLFPPVLRVLSFVLPTDFPYHPNWKTDVTHPAYWEVSATIDHLVPVTRGGEDTPTNWVTTSMVRNSAKMNWTLEELGWILHPPGDIHKWDGMLRWFVEYTLAHPDVIQGQGIRLWLHAARSALEQSVI